jgi:hypothetical protein
MTCAFWPMPRRQLPSPLGAAIVQFAPTPDICRPCNGPTLTAGPECPARGRRSVDHTKPRFARLNRPRLGNMLFRSLAPTPNQAPRVAAY